MLVTLLCALASRLPGWTRYLRFLSPLTLFRGTELASGSRGHLAVINDAGVLKARAFGSAYCDTPSLD